MTYRFREGDLVSVKARVKYDQNSDYVFIDIGGETVYAPTNKLELISQTIEIGDLVLVLPGFVAGHVRGISGEQAWIELDHGAFMTERVESLRRAQDQSGGLQKDPRSNSEGLCPLRQR